MDLRPITLKEARAFVSEHHRHPPAARVPGPPVGGKFGVALWEAGVLVGVGVAGRPTARHLDDGATLEITRCCTTGCPNACTQLYGALWRAGRALGYRRAVTYTLTTEPGTSLRAAGFRRAALVVGQRWGRPSRPRPSGAAPDRWRWEIP